MSGLHLTIRIEHKDGYSVRVKLYNCNRDTLSESPLTAAALRILEDSMPSSSENEDAP